jgi:hypothetical protein
LEPADVRRGTWQVLMVNRLCSGTSDSEEGAHIVRFYKIGQRRSMYAASSAGALLIWASDIPTAHEKGPGAMPGPFVLWATVYVWVISARGPDAFSLVTAAYTGGGADRGTEFRMATVIISPSLGLLLIRRPLFLYAFRSATACFHLIHVPSR